ncbi:MAG: hypothetical protein J6J60_04995 [Clostridia bacterium]|nr:hypothetical protein [Clostridia bacterium]
MKSICVKFLNQKDIDFFIDKMNKNIVENSKYNLRKFKIFYNVIIHYTGEEKEKFLYKLAMILSEYIINTYENKIIKQIINRNYFYLEEYEKEIVYKIALRILQLQEIEFQYKSEIVTEIIYDYLLHNKAFYMKGFVNFRLKEYFEILDYVVELAVENYIKYI